MTETEMDRQRQEVQKIVFFGFYSLLCKINGEPIDISQFLPFCMKPGIHTRKYRGEKS